MWWKIGIPKYLNIHKIIYKFIKKRKKCDVTIKSTITKKTIIGKKISDWNNKKSTKRETKLGRERERLLASFVMGNLEGIEEWGGNEIIRNLCKN